MTVDAVIAALNLPVDARVDQHVPKKLLAENGAPTPADKRQINDGVEELFWLAALKPVTIGVPIYRDSVREYLEVAVLSVTLRAGARTPRLTELIHRAIPYPVFLIQTQPCSFTLSLAHLRWSQGQSGQTVLEGPLITAALDVQATWADDFLGSLNISSQPHQHLHALYQGWIERFEAQAAAQVSGKYSTVTDAVAVEHRRAALAEHERLTREIISLRARTATETQLNRRVELNLEIKRLESCLVAVASHF